MAVVQIAEVVIKLIDNMTGPLQRVSRQVTHHTNVITNEFKRLERGVGSFIGAFAGLSVVTREMGKLTETMKEYSRTQAQILSMNLRPPSPGQAPGPGPGGLYGTLNSAEYIRNRNEIMRQSIISSKRYNVTPESVLQEIMALRGYGIPMAEAITGAGPLVGLARVTGQKDYGEMTRQIMGMATEFRLPVDATRIDQTTGRMANMMLWLRSKNLKIPEILEAAKFSGQAMASSGMQIEDFAAVLAGLAERQVTGSQAGVMLRSDYTRALALLGPNKAGRAALEKYGGYERFITDMPVTSSSLQMALESQFLPEAGGMAPTEAELAAAAAIKEPRDREEMVRRMARNMAPEAYDKAMRDSPEALSRMIQLVNVAAGKKVNLTGFWDDKGQWQAGLIETLGGDPAGMGRVFEPRQSNRNLTAAAAMPLIRELSKQGRNIPPNMLDEALKITNVIDNWDAAFERLANSMQRAFVTFGDSKVGKRILDMINGLADWIDDMSDSFSRMSEGDQIKLVVDSLLALFAGLKLLLDVLQNNMAAAVVDFAAFEAITQKNPILKKHVDPVMRGILKTVFPDIALKGDVPESDLVGPQFDLGPLLPNGLYIKRTGDWMEKALRWLFNKPREGKSPPRSMDLTKGLPWWMQMFMTDGRDLDRGADPSRFTPLENKLWSENAERRNRWRMEDLMRTLTHDRDRGADPNRFTPLQKLLWSEDADRRRNWRIQRMPRFRGKAQDDLVANWPMEVFMSIDQNLADLPTKNAREMAGIMPPALKKAFLESLQEWYGGNPGMAPGGVNGFGWGIGGTQLGGSGMGGIGAGGFRGGGFGGGQGALSDNGKAFMRRLIDKWHFSPASAAIAAGQVDWESAGFQPGISGDQGQSHGYGQWNGARWARIVAASGGRWPSADQQTDFYAQEWINRGLSINERDFSRFHQLGHAMEGYRYGPTAHEGDRLARGQKWLNWINGKGDSGSVRDREGGTGTFGEYGVSALGGHGLDPGFASRLNQLHEMAARAGIHFRIQPGEGYRSFEEQARIYASHRGTGRPGARPGFSYHNYGRAGDLQHEDGTPLTMSELIALGRMAPQVGLTWGGGFRDPAHFQWGPAGGAGWLLRQRQQHGRLDVHIHDDGIRMAAKGDVPIRANYRGKRMAETGRTSWRG